MRNHLLLPSILFAATAVPCQAQVTDPCPLERADFTDNAPLSSSEKLSATLGDRKLGEVNAFEFPTETSLALTITTEDSSPISSLLVGVSRSDDGTGVTSVPCDSLASGITFEPPSPQDTVTAFISVEESNSHVVLDVTVVLEDDSFLFDIYSVEFFDTVFQFPSPSPPKSPMPVSVTRANRQDAGISTTSTASGKGRRHGKGHHDPHGKGHGKGKGKYPKSSSVKIKSVKSASSVKSTGKGTTGKSTSGKNTSGKGASEPSASNGKGLSVSSKGSGLGKGYSSV